MDLALNNSLFVVGGVTSGLGRAIAMALIAEGASVIGVARTKEKLLLMQKEYPALEVLTGDLADPEVLPELLSKIGERVLSGAVINAGGPPAMPAMDTTLADWDEAYRTVVRWKIALTQALLPKMMANGYGRLLYVESVSVKHPIENLVLSNAMRLAVVGYVKTLSQEIGTSGVTMNILGPGYHSTPRMEDLFKKNGELKGVSEEAVRQTFAAQTAVGHLGKPADFASLAVWLLSPHSGYITGQTIAVDGGLVRGTLG